MDEVVKEANTVNQERNTMHTEKRTRDKKLRDAQVSWGGGGGGGGLVIKVYYDVDLGCRMLLKR